MFTKLKLNYYNQQHLLTFYNELNNNEKINLLNDIKKIDFKLMHDIYVESYKDEDVNVNNISPLKCITNIDNKKDNYQIIGEELIKNNEYAVVIMAGGNASRLGISYPKGSLELNINNKKISLFEMYINQLKEIYNKYQIYINLYIMTSTTNNMQTITFFKEHNYFDYPKDNIQFFIQDDLPILDIEGKVLLKEKDKVLFGPNGNGNVFKSLLNSGYINDMKKKNIKYVLFSTVDNALTKLVDIPFIGCVLDEKYKLATKTITKQDSNEKDYIFCKYNNHPFMLPTEFITEEITNKIIDNEYVYREKNITYHLISTDLVEKFAHINLRYNRAYKKYNYIDLKTGELVIANSNNSFKFERFIFDAFYYADDMLLYRVDTSEFCPIKKYEDIEKVEKEVVKRLIP